MKICVYGGGNIAHSLVATIGMWHPVTIITHHPNGWLSQIAFRKDVQPNKTTHNISSTSDMEAAKDADVVLIAVPQFAYETAIYELEQVVKPRSTLVFVPAPAKAYEHAMRLERQGINVIGFQRVPHIARIVEYGKEVVISSDRAVHRLATTMPALHETWARLTSLWFGGEVEFLSSFRIFAFNNSNPLLHPSRMTVLFSDWRNKVYADCPYMYSDWTDDSSELYLAADDDMANLVAQCPEIDAQRDFIPIRRHYEVNTPREMTAKLRSIPSFKSIRAPMKQIGTQWIPDFASRYFTEDIDYGLKAMVDIAREKDAYTPAISNIYDQMSTIRKS